MDRNFISIILTFKRFDDFKYRYKTHVRISGISVTEFLQLDITWCIQAPYTLLGWLVRGPPLILQHLGQLGLKMYFYWKRHFILFKYCLLCFVNVWCEIYTPQLHLHFYWKRLCLVLCCKAILYYVASCWYCLTRLYTVTRSHVLQLAQPWLSTFNAKINTAD